MPLNQFRNYQALINLVPGASPAALPERRDRHAGALAGDQRQRPEPQQQRDPDGRRDQRQHLAAAPPDVRGRPAETIDTVNISTNNFDAEQGMAGGAAITVITKSGTNEFKGSAFEFYNNEKLNANAYYFGGNRPAGKPDKPPVDAQHLRRHPRRPDREEQAVLLRVVSKATRPSRPSTSSSTCPTRRCATATSAARSTPTARLQVIYDPLDGQRRRHGPHAVSEQPDSGQPHQPDRDAVAGLLPGAQHRRASAPAA